MSETESKAGGDEVAEEKAEGVAPEQERPEGAGGTATMVRPPATKARKVAERTWWLPWLLGAAAVVVGALVFTDAFGWGDPTPEERMEERKAGLPVSTHKVVYEVNGVGKSPEIRYVVDGIATNETVEGADLPWRKEIDVTVGPGVGIAQLLAANSEADSISCTVSVDGQVVSQGVVPGANSNVACSAVIQPTAK